MNSIKQKINKYINNRGLVKTPAYFIKELFNDICDNLISDPIKITYKELKNLRDNSLLKPKQEYQIIDYVTSTIQDKTRSVNNYFDIIVKAINENTLSENARAAYSERDTNNYFGQSDLSKWELKYSLDNDSEKYAWVNPTDKEIQQPQKQAIFCQVSGLYDEPTYTDIPDSMLELFENKINSGIYNIILLDDNNKEYINYPYKYQVTDFDTNDQEEGYTSDINIYLSELPNENTSKEQYIDGICMFNINVITADEANGIYAGNYYIKSDIFVYKLYNQIVNVTMQEQTFCGVITEGNVSSDDYTITLNQTGVPGMVLQSQSNSDSYSLSIGGYKRIYQISQIIYLEGYENFDNIEFEIKYNSDNNTIYNIEPLVSNSNLDIIHTNGRDGIQECEIVWADGTTEIINLNIIPTNKYRLYENQGKYTVTEYNTSLYEYNYTYIHETEQGPGYINTMNKLDIYSTMYSSESQLLYSIYSSYGSVPKYEISVQEQEKNKPIIIKAGTGVIYYMKDEFGNECPYDFKNIQFYSDNNFLNTLLSNSNTDTQYFLNYYIDNPNNWYYTFSDVNYNISLTGYDLTTQLKDLSLTSKTFKIPLQTDYTNLQSLNYKHGVENNKIKPNYINPEIINFIKLLFSNMTYNDLLDALYICFLLQEIELLFITTTQYLSYNIFLSFNIFDLMSKIFELQNEEIEINSESLSLLAVYGNILEHNELNENSMNNVFLGSCNNNKLNNTCVDNIFHIYSNNNNLYNCNNLILFNSNINYSIENNDMLNLLSSLSKIYNKNCSFDIKNISGFLQQLLYISENFDALSEYISELDQTEFYNFITYKYIGDNVQPYQGVIKVINSLDGKIKYIYDYSCDELDWEYITE